MYQKSDVFNIKNSDYELTAMDERIYNEKKLVLHQVDKDMIVYKDHFGSVLNQTVYHIHRNGEIEAGMWYLTNRDDKDYDEIELSEDILELLKLKYKELLEGYWQN